MTQNAWQLQTIEQAPSLKENELYVWRTTVPININNLYYYWSLLTQDEKIRATEFYSIQHRNSYIIARGILRKLIASYLNSNTEDILFSYTKHGKPYLANHHVQGLKFNLAHSRGSIVYGFTKNIDVGIDIEFINKNFAIDDIVRYCCSQQEKDKFLQLSHNQKYSYFYKLWVIKEAFVKGIGFGLSYNLKHINISFNKNKLSHPILTVHHDNICWTINLFSSYARYSSAFAVNKIIDRVVFFDLL